jgi:hypothetical protein
MRTLRGWIVMSWIMLPGVRLIRAPRPITDDGV